MRRVGFSRAGGRQSAESTFPIRHTLLRASRRDDKGRMVTGRFGFRRRPVLPVQNRPISPAVPASTSLKQLAAGNQALPDNVKKCPHASSIAKIPVRDEP